jgi:glycosyltransferase involved in cell wall biosynthesis
MTARIVPEKGVREFIGAATVVRDHDPSVRFVIAGFFESGSRGMPKDRFLADCRRAGVEYIGHVEDIRSVMADCTVFALPSYYGEGRPRSIQEALATGRPVVTTDNVGCRDAIEDGVHGCIVPVRDDQALARGIMAALELADRLETPHRCRQFAEERYCASSVAAGWLTGVGALDVAGLPDRPWARQRQGDQRDRPGQVGV